MTEISYLWDGIVTGDATEAPYDKSEFGKYLLGSLVAESGEAFVVPGYLKELNFSVSGGYVIAVNTGAALLKNYVYINDTAKSFVIEQPSSTSYFRYDYIVLRLDANAQTIRLAIVKGSNTDDYTLLENPILTQTLSVWEAPLAKIFVDGSEISILDKYIYDNRSFAVTAYSENLYPDGLSKNLLRNSELMAWAAAVTNIPEQWYVSGGTPATRTSVMSRGQSISLSAASAYQFVYLGDVVRTFTVKGSFIEITGNNSTATIEFQIYDGVTPITVKEQSYKKLEPNDEIEFQFTFTVDDDVDISQFNLRITNAGGTTNFGQIIVVPGYHPGQFRQFSEIIPFKNAITDAAWSNTAKSSGTTTINFTAAFGNDVLPQTKAVILRLRGRDSGSAAGTPYMEVLGYVAPFIAAYGRLSIQGVTNDVYREMVVIAPVNQPIWNAYSQSPQLRITVGATGAGTFDATVEVIGIII